MNEFIAAIARRKGEAALVIAGVCFGVVAWLWFASTRQAPHSESSQVVDPMTRKRTQESQWAECPIIDLEPDARPKVDSWIHTAASRSEGIVPAAASDAFVQTIARHIMARSSTDPEAYLSLAPIERTTWLSPDASNTWKPIEERYRFLTGNPPNRADPKEVLRALILCRPGGPCPRWKAVAATGTGVRIEFGKVRSPDEAHTPLIAGADAIGFWYGAPAFNAYRLRKPPRSIEQVAGDGVGVYIAEARLIVVHADDTRSAWHTAWYWDPLSGVWCNREMHMYSWNVQPTYY